MFVVGRGTCKILSAGKKEHVADPAWMCMCFAGWLEGHILCLLAYCGPSQLGCVEMRVPVLGQGRPPGPAFAYWDLKTPWI